jgi:hypothetical protein
MALPRVYDPREGLDGLHRIGANTLFLESFWASEALLTELRAKESTEVDGAPQALRVSGEGRLLPFAGAGHEVAGKVEHHD